MKRGFFLRRMGIARRQGAPPLKSNVFAEPARPSPHYS